MAPQTPEGWPLMLEVAWVAGLSLTEVSPVGVVPLEGEVLLEGSWGRQA